MLISLRRREASLGLGRKRMSVLHLIFTATAGTLQSLDVKALAEWISASGGYVGPVAAQQRGGYRGLFCTQDGVRAGEPLLAVPRCCTLRGAAGKGKRPIEMLITSLLAERDAGATSEFAQYIESLPASVPLLRDWSTARLNRLDAPDLAFDALSQHEWLARLGESQDHDFKHVEWAERLCRSRGIAYSDAESGESGLQLVPLLDLANHRVQPSDAHPPLVEYEDGVTVLCACTDLEAGDEATFAYTEEGNARLLLDYGFAALKAPGVDADIEYVDLEGLEAMLEESRQETVARLQLPSCEEEESEPSEEK